MKRLELALETKCCAYARKLGVAAVKLEKNGHVGVPDREFIRRGGDNIYVEFKRSENESLKPEQEFWRYFVGDKHHVICDYNDFINLDFFKQAK